MKKKKIPFKVTLECLRVFKNVEEYPVKQGNYCFIGDTFYSSYQCLNMWVENVKEIKKNIPELDKVDVAIFGRFCFIVDERIPVSWRSSFCLLGWEELKPSVKILKEILEFAGKSTNNYICGCEKEQDSPDINEGYSYIFPQIGKNHCNKCGRSWDIENEGNFINLTLKPK